MRNFKKCLVKMFAAKNQECCFIETVVKPRRRRGWVPWELHSASTPSSNAYPPG